jgi:hypothetical protein
MAPAGKGFRTSKIRKVTNTIAAAVHVAGAKSAAVAIPATSSMTIREWSLPPKMTSARPADQIARQTIATRVPSARYRTQAERIG